MRAELREALLFFSPSLRVRAESTGGGREAGETLLFCACAPSQLRHCLFPRVRSESPEAPPCLSPLMRTESAEARFGSLPARAR